MSNPFELINKNPKSVIESKREDIELKRSLEISEALGGFSMIESKLKKLSQEYGLPMPEKEETNMVEKFFTKVILMQGIPYDSASIDQFCDSVEKVINEKYDKQIAELEEIV